MTLKKLSEKDSVLFNRKELEFEHSFKGKTPSKDEIKKLIIQNENSKEEFIVIQKMHQIYGVQKLKIHAKIYKTEQDLKNAEVINKKPKKKEETK